ncbi:hypothetical protein T439DRAFT_325374 [Meredithblackwellia eburnea MCA 4105]
MAMATNAKKTKSSTTKSTSQPKPFASSKSATAAAASSSKKKQSQSQSQSSKDKQPSSSSSSSFDPYDPKWNTLFKISRKKMGTPVHGQAFTPVDVILKVFDCEEDYGPCSNVTRLERYERAQMLGLDPPEELGQLLRSCPTELHVSAFNGEAPLSF